MAAILKKIVVRNVGVLKAFDTPNAPKFARLTTIYARNGRGKSTLSAILRASTNGNTTQIRSRRTLANDSADPDVTLVFEPGFSVRFTNGAWNRPETPIEVFDASFIAENLFAGEAIDLEHDRGLFSIILGRTGVKLMKQQNFFSTAAKRAATHLKEAESSLKGDLPTDMSWEEFLASTPPANIDDQIAQSQKDLKAIQQAGRLAQLRKLETIPVPSLDVDLQATLARTVQSIDSSARDRLAAHFAKFQLGKKGEPWIRYGQEHVHEDSCPFCGKSGANDLGLVTLYSQIFGEAYQAHFEGIRKSGENLDLAVGPDALTRASRTIAANSEAILAWAEFYPVDGNTLPDIETYVTEASKAHAILKGLFEAKRQSPLVPVIDDDKLKTAVASLDIFAVKLAAYNTAVCDAEKLIEAGRASPQQTEHQIIARLENLRKRKRRFDSAVQARVDAVLRAKRRDARAKSIRTIVQTRLKTANEVAAAHYHTAVNKYLQRFGATFHISKITNSMTGNAGSVDYGLVVRGHPVVRGRGRTIADQPSFTNSLSTGDKTTLAFAFFLAGLDRDQALEEKIIVFDDPLSSHDTHREKKTVDILKQLYGRCAQLIILSHDAYFLRRIAKRCAGADHVSYEIKYIGAEQWSQAEVADLDELCISEHALHLKKLISFFDHREGNPADIAPIIRRVLETHYRRTYTAYFSPTDNLGTIIRKIKGAGAGHPCEHDIEALESCNENTSDEHHGSNPEVAPKEPIDEDNLHGIVGDCLTLVHALAISA